MYFYIIVECVLAMFVTMYIYANDTKHTRKLICLVQEIKYVNLILILC